MSNPLVLPCFYCFLECAKYQQTQPKDLQGVEFEQVAHLKKAPAFHLLALLEPTCCRPLAETYAFPTRLQNITDLC